MRELRLSERKAGLLLKILVLVLGVILCSMIKCSCGEEDAPKARYGFVTFTMQWNYLLPGHEMPRNLRYCFYPSGQGAMIQTEGDCNSLKFALPPGTYRVLIFNCDAENIRFESMQTFEAAEAALMASTEQTENALTPLYAVVDTLTIIPGQNLDYQTEPKPLVQQVFFNIKVENGESIRRCSASLSGVMPALKLSNRNRKDTSFVTLPFSMEKTGNGFKQDILLLDVLNDTTVESPQSNMLKLDFLLINNRIVTSTVDLGDMLSTYDKQHIVVEVSASIDKSSSPSVSFHNWKVRPLYSEERANQL